MTTPDPDPRPLTPDDLAWAVRLGQGIADAHPLVPAPRTAPDDATTTAAHAPWCARHIADDGADGYRICYGPTIELEFPARDSRADACHGATVVATDDSESVATVNVRLGDGLLYEITRPEARALAYALLAQASRADGNEGAHDTYSDVSAAFAAPTAGGTR